MLRRTCLFVVFTSALLLSISQSPLAGPRGTDRPLKGSLTGEVTFAFGDVECVPVNGVGVMTTTVAWGNLSHLGKVQAVFSHCPGPLEGGEYKYGELTLWAANQDEVWATYEDADGLPPFVLHFAGGTGRFKGAEGTANLDWVVQPMFDESGNMDFFVPWPWWATIEGVLSY